MGRLDCMERDGSVEKGESILGTLYLCATPIGNLEDITLRVLRILKEVDLIAAEDTRNSIKLLDRYDIHTPMTSYHEHNKIKKGHILVEKLQQGLDVALITDAGTPGISDPGEELVNMCHEKGIEVTALPGAAACIMGLTLSGLPTRNFVFEGFLPMETKKRREVLKGLTRETRTILLYEAPHRLVRTLEELVQSLGGKRKAVLCRELTKRHESVLRLDLEGLLARAREQEPRGECVLVIQGRDRRELRAEEQAQWEALSLKEHMERYEGQGCTRKDAMKQVARDRGLGKREVYRLLLEGEE